MLGIKQKLDEIEEREVEKKSFEDYLLKRLVKDEKIPEESFERLYQEYDFFLTTVCLQPNSYLSSETTFETVKKYKVIINYIEMTFEKCGLLYYIIKHRYDEIIIFTFIKEMDETIENKLKDALFELENYIGKNYKDISITYGISDRVNWRSNINKVYLSSRFVSLINYLAPEDYFYYLENGKGNLEDFSKIIDYLEESILYTIKMASFEHFNILLDAWFGIWMEQKTIPLRIIKNRSIELINFLIKQSKGNTTYFYNSEMAKDIQDYEEIKNFILEIAENLIIENSSDFEKKQILEIVNAFVKDNYYKQLTGKRIATYVYISEEILDELFNKYMEKSVVEYLTEVRMNIAKTLIEEGESLSLVCEKIGYKDNKGFRRIFECFFGKKPGEIQ